MLPSGRRVSTCTRCAAGCPTARGPLVSAPRVRRAVSRGSTPRGPHPAVASRRELHAHRQRRLLLDPARLRPDEDVAADPRREAAHHLADRGREDVDSANDEHVVGAADAADARAGAAARARGRPHAARGRACGSAAAARRGAAGASARARRWRRRSSRERGARCRDRSARGGRSRGRRGASRPAARTRPTARRRCRRCPSPRSPARPSRSSSVARNAGSPPPGSPGHEHALDARALRGRTARPGRRRRTA